MASRSTLVTVVAWILMALSALAACIAGVQSWVLMTDPEFAALQQSLAAKLQEGDSTWLYQSFLWLMVLVHWVVLATAIFMLGLLISAVGLLRRQAWARRTVVVMLWLGVVYEVVSVVWAYCFISQVYAALPANEVPEGSMGMFAVGAGIATLVALTMAWWAWRLGSPKVAAEFH